MSDTVTGLPSETVAEIESFVDGWLVEQDVPGASVAITDADGIVYAEGFGARDLAANTAATPETLYKVASISKTFTGVAVLQLAEDRRLSLSDPVGEYVDVYDDVPGDPVTVAELLSHTSGIPTDDVAWIKSPRLGSGQGPTVPLSTREEFDRHVAGNARRRTTDRRRCMYYNSGYAVLGRVVEACSDLRFADYVEDRVLEPLGMERSTFDREPVEAETDRTFAYESTDEGRERTEFQFEELSNPNGGLISSAAELTSFLRALINDGRGDEARLLSADSVATLTDPQARFRTLVDGTEESYAHGTMVRPFGDDRLVGHGGTWGCSGFAGYLEKAGLGVAVLANTVPDVHPMEVGPALLGIANGRAPEDANPYFAVTEKLKTVAGTYESYRGLQTAEVEPTGLSLEVSIGSEERRTTYTCFPESADPDDYDFYTVSGKLHRLPVEFTVDDDAVDLFVARNRLTKRT